jgi:hypothetical protein
MGEARTYVGAVNKQSDGSYLMDPKIPAAKQVSSYWSWDATGPDKNPLATEVVWSGAHTWANKEKWLGELVMPNDFSLPTYPDGSSALGWMTGKEGSKDPRDYKLYDALACKSVLGTFVEQEQYEKPVGGNSTAGMIKDTLLSTGKERFVGDYYFSRDMAAPWWLDFNRNAISYFIERGVDAFWVDNYTGWGHIGNMPVLRAFGDWSTAKFNDYLKKHPINGIDSSKFNIRDYMVNKFEKEFNGTIPSVITYSWVGQWKSDEWLRDPVWMSYLAFKSETSYEAQKAFYTMVKEEAKRLGKDPDSILVGGNDISGSNYAAAESDQYIDMAHTEYSPNYSAVTQSRTDGYFPVGQAAGFYRAANQYTKSRRSTIWYYLDGPYEKYRGNYNLGSLIAYEALSNNCMIYSGSDTHVAGSLETAKDVNAFISPWAIMAIWVN